MKEIPFYILESDEISTFSERTVKAIQESNLTDSFVSLVLGQLVILIQKLLQALGRIRKSEHTEKLISADKIRDKLFIGFRDYVFSFCNNPDEEKVAAGRKLTIILENIGTTIYRLNYSVETAEMNALFVELDKPESTAAIAKISGDSWYSALKGAQAAFETIYQDKVVKNNETEIPLIIETTKQIKFFMGALFSYIEVNTILNPEVYRPVSVKLDTIITDVVTVARARQTRKINEKAEASEIGSSPETVSN